MTEKLPPPMQASTEVSDPFVQKMLADMRRSREEQKVIEAHGRPALERLFKIANGESGQCRHVAKFLLGLYNGSRFPFDLTDLRCVDKAIFDDCLAVMKMDRQPQQEVHCYFENGGKRFEALAKDWGVLDMVALRNSAQDAGVEMRGL